MYLFGIVVASIGLQLSSSTGSFQLVIGSYYDETTGIFEQVVATTTDDATAAGDGGGGNRRPRRQPQPEPVKHSVADSVSPPEGITIPSSPRLAANDDNNNNSIKNNNNSIKNNNNNNNNNHHIRPMDDATAIDGEDSRGGGVPSTELPHWSPEMRDHLLQELQQHRAVQPRWVSVGEERIVSYISSTGQLIVPVNHKYALWHDGHLRLCNLLRQMTLTTAALADAVPFPPLLPSPILNMTFECEQIDKDPGFGPGNWVTAIYAARISAAYAKVEFHYQTTQQLPVLPEEEKEGQQQPQRTNRYEFDILPWFRVVQPAPTVDDPWPFDGGLPSSEGEVCAPYKFLRLDRMAHEIQKDVRAMAWQIVEPPSYLLQDESKSFAPPTIAFPAPLSRIPNITLDDVALHFRCGDVLGGANRNDFGMIQFTEYIKWIDPNTTTIGILTQPFEKHRVRRQDSGKTNDCRQAVYLLVNYLQGHFPHARITIRNNELETLPLTYARIVMAKQAFTSLSSFGIFPVIATYGRGYFQQGNQGVNPFTGGLPHRLPNLTEMTAPVLGSLTIRKMGLNATLAWFVKETE